MLRARAAAESCCATAACSRAVIWGSNRRHSAHLRHAPTTLKRDATSPALWIVLPVFPPSTTCLGPCSKQSAPPLWPLTVCRGFHVVNEE